MRYEYLREFANIGREQEVLDALLQTENQKRAGKLINLSERQIRRYLTSMKKRAAMRGIAPEADMANRVAEGMSVRGVSTLYSQDGDVKAQWVKSQASPLNNVEIVQEMHESFASSLPREKAVKPPKAVNDDLLSLYVLTDYHLGMLAWGEETGADWDIKIAEDLLVNWFLTAISRSDNAKVGVLAQLGDLLHYDGMEAVTPASGNILDADSRFQKVVRVAIRAFRRVIREMLKKHEQVHIIHAEGNHDPASSIWLRELFHTLYEDEPRVTVDLSPDPYYCYEFGDTSLYFHHGHKRKAGNIDDVFVAKFREVYGRTKYAYGHIGHLHHKHTIEGNLMVVEQHRTLASPDAYASRGGWMSGRSSDLIVYHRGFGEIGRHTIPPEMV